MRSYLSTFGILFYLVLSLELLNRFPFMSIICIICFIAYASLAYFKPKFVLESIAGWSPSNFIKFFWFQRILCLLGFAGLNAIIYFGLKEMLHRLDPSPDDFAALGALATIGSVFGMFMLCEFARMRHEEVAFKYMISKLDDLMTSNAHEISIIEETIKNEIAKNKPTLLNFIEMGIYDIERFNKRILYLINVMKNGK